MTRNMTGQPETVDELQTANQKSQETEQKALDEVGVTRSEVMELVETFDQYESTGTAWYEADENGVRVKANVTARSTFDAMDDAVINGGFDAYLELNENDDVIVLELTGGEEGTDKGGEPEVVKSDSEYIESLNVGDMVTVNHSGKALDGGTYKVTGRDGEHELTIEDTDGNEGWMVRTYGGESRLHISETGTTHTFSLMKVE